MLKGKFRTPRGIPLQSSGPLKIHEDRVPSTPNWGWAHRTKAQTWLEVLAHSPVMHWILCQTIVLDVVARFRNGKRGTQNVRDISTPLSPSQSIHIKAILNLWRGSKNSYANPYTNFLHTLVAKLSLKFLPLLYVLHTRLSNLKY